MTSKNSLSNQKVHQGVFDLRLIFATIRRNLWLPVLACLVFFFGIPVVTAMLLQNGSVGLNELGAAEQVLQIQNMMASVVEINQGISIAIIMVGALLAAMTMFHYLQRKKQMDFYHALPISRSKWFVTNYLAGFLVFLLPFIAATILNILVIGLFGFWGDFLWGAYAQSLLNHILFFLAIYSAVVFAIMLTGTMLAALQVTVLLLAVGPAVVGIYSLICSMFYPTFYTALWDWSYWLMGTSPVARYITSSQYALSGMAYT